jgi:hypothetical protein
MQMSHQAQHHLVASGCIFMRAGTHQAGCPPGLDGLRILTVGPDSNGPLFSCTLLKPAPLAGAVLQVQPGSMLTIFDSYVSSGAHSFLRRFC